MKRENMSRYSLNLNLSTEELSRLKHHVSVFGYKCLGDFAKQAVCEKMVNDLVKLPPAKRRPMETVLNQLIADDTDSLI
jgi:hypothetical protein